MEAKTVHALTSQSFDVLLEENATSGYRWRPSELPSDIELLEDVSLLSPGGRIGGGGQRRFTLRAKRPGTFVVWFELRREWESVALRRHSVQIIVK
jgi:predicted secreted protein